MAQIVISRPKERRANRLRSYKILVDGEASATLSNGGEATVNIAAGRHTVRAALDWCSSPTISVELADGDRAYLVCQSGFRSSLIRPTAMLYVTIWRKRYLDLHLLRTDSSA